MNQSIHQDEIVFFDTEVSITEDKVVDIGAVRSFCPVSSLNGMQFHSGSKKEFENYIKNAFFVCGHNIIDFDLKYMFSVIESAGVRSVIDTLYMSALLFPKNPYHKLLKDDKIQSESLNNPLNDAIKAMELFLDEVSAFDKLDINIKIIYCTLLESISEFRGFFRYINFKQKTTCIEQHIKGVFIGKICDNVNLEYFIKEYPVELAYTLAVIYVDDKGSIIPYWVQKKYPKVNEVYTALKGKPCVAGCRYCNNTFNIYAELKKKFGYDSFRKYAGEPLQEKAVEAAVNGKSLLAIFPTGGGKSITFQLPALIAADSMNGLTVVISPLQSLMKDQVDNLNKLGITDAVTINGLLNIVERAEAIERIQNGIASILYISPESLRSKTIERLILGRNITRFVIDEAHCFSSWGQDFRVDYLYIGDFILNIQQKKRMDIPVSCFTATAKQKVVSDIKEYFKQKLNIELELFTTSATRANLRYEVIYRENDSDKYITLRNLIEQKNCPTIIYASRTKRTVEISQRLCNDGFNALAFHGKMSNDDKISNQEAFIRGEAQIIVATSAFGMGVDKKDVKLVIHYDISDSLENYVQEAGRAGRDENIQAECYVLFNENDLDKHFTLLNQTKLSINEIQQIWKGIKTLTKSRGRVCCSALEIARQAGWDENVLDIETKVKTAISALEISGYVKRGQNSPRVFADSIQVKTANEAVERINNSNRFSEKQKEYAIRIIKKLISTRSRSRADAQEAESRVDYIADSLAIEKREVIESVNIMKQEGILASDKEMSVYVDMTLLRNNTKNTVLSKYSQLEYFLMEKLSNDEKRINYKVINEEAYNKGIKFSTVNNIRLLLYFWIIKGYIKKPEGEMNTTMMLSPTKDVVVLKLEFENRIRVAQFIEEYFLYKARENSGGRMENDYVTVNFSILELQRAYNQAPSLFSKKNVDLSAIEEALLYLSKINAFRLEGGFLVLYNAMDIIRLETDNKKRYKVEDYKQLKEFYNSKTQQIHIVGEYANMMVKDYNAALTFVNDYFQMDYKLFLTKYFKGTRLSEIDRNITPMKYQMLFEKLSVKQAEIINDDKSKAIVVAAGPGSGKTKVLVHKLASLMLLEDIKHEQLLMLTFSRAAAMEFKLRLLDLIGDAAYFVEIKTFHSYCFDLLGKVGNIEGSKNVVHDATVMIKNGDVELDRITKNVLVIDEAQDMDFEEFELVKTLMERNEEMRVIAVGDDDQNIYEFRGSNSAYMASILHLPDSKGYELIENFRSNKRIVDFSNMFVRTIENRLKNQDIVSIKQERGEVNIVKIKTSLEMSVARLIMGTWRNKENRTAAVITSTNEQAYLISNILNKAGFKTYLAQSNEGFLLYDLSEIRYFLELIGKGNIPIITDDVWDCAKEEMLKKYLRSTNIEAVKNLLDKFKCINNKIYYTDLEAFLREAQFEDFINSKNGEICISTIHKSKGREFDYVYMMVSGWKKLTDEQKRGIYVGITRAKEKLYIGYDSNMEIFDYIKYKNIKAVEQINWFYDDHIYETPHEIILPLTHRDIWLGFFTDVRISNLIEYIQSGDELLISEERENGDARIYFGINIKGRIYKVASASKKFYSEVVKQKERGYGLYKAKVLFTLKWRDKNTDNEYNILLPVVTMKKGNEKCKIN